jgi:hypothetical protein
LHPAKKFQFNRGARRGRLRLGAFAGAENGELMPAAMMASKGRSRHRAKWRDRAKNQTEKQA